MPQFLSDLVLPRDPDDALDAATKQYVDAAGGGGGATEVYAQTTTPVVAASILWVDTDSVVTEDGVYGSAGTTILSGIATPSGATGAIGDYYLDTDDHILYGPRNPGYGSGYSAYTSQTPGETVTAYSGYAFGADFTCAVAGRITGISFYRVSSSAATTRSLRLYTTGGSLLGSASTTAESGSGWKVATLATPVVVTAGQIVRTAYDTPGDTGRTVSGASSIVNGALTRGQVYYNTSPGSFPLNTTGSDYFSDLVFEPEDVPWPVAVSSGLDQTTADTLYAPIDSMPLVLGPEDPVPGGTPAGTIIVRTVT